MEFVIKSLPLPDELCQQLMLMDQLNPDNMKYAICENHFKSVLYWTNQSRFKGQKECFVETCFFAASKTCESLRLDIRKNSNTYKNNNIIFPCTSALLTVLQNELKIFSL